MMTKRYNKFFENNIDDFYKKILKLKKNEKLTLDISDISGIEIQKLVSKIENSFYTHISSGNLAVQKK